MVYNEKIVVLFYDKNLTPLDELEALAKMLKKDDLGQKFFFVPKELDACIMTKEEIIKMVEEW